jgi:hypothetical protein
LSEIIKDFGNYHQKYNDSKMKLARPASNLIMDGADRDKISVSMQGKPDSKDRA